MSNKFQFVPGRIQFDEVIIKKKDNETNITDLIVEVNTETSILSTTIEADFMVLDAKNVLSNLPIEAGDEISFTVTYADGPFKMTFVLVHITEIQDLQSQRTYNLKCCSRLQYNSMFRNISRSYFGATSDIAFQIYKENTTEKFGIWEASVGGQSLIVPNWSPVKTLSWLANRSTAAYDDTRFYFYQDSFGRYNFTPIEKFRELYRSKTPMKYTYRKNNQMKSTNGESIPNSAALANSILEIEFHDSFEFNFAARGGKLGGIRFQTDINTKTMNITTYDYWRDFKRESRLNDFPTWSVNKEAVTGLLQYDNVLSNTHPKIALNKVNDRSNLKQTSLDESQTITIVVKGNQTVDLGMVVDIEIPSPEPKTDNMRDQFDRRWSGKYYVVSKRDMYTKELKQTALTLTKESLTDLEIR